MPTKLENKPFSPNWFQCNCYTKTIHENPVFMRHSESSVTFLQSSQSGTCVSIGVRYLCTLKNYTAPLHIYFHIEFPEFSHLDFSSQAFVFCTLHSFHLSSVFSLSSTRPQCVSHSAKIIEKLLLVLQSRLCTYHSQYFQSAH